MTYLDLVISGLYRGVALVWPVSGDMLVTRLYAWASDPALAALLRGNAGIGAGLALVVVLRAELFQMINEAWLVAKRRQEGSLRLLLSVLLGAIPLLLAEHLWSAPLSVAPWLSAAALIGSGLVLLIADKLGVTIRDLHHLSVPNYLTIGIVQALASLIGIAPQVAAIAIARLLGCERDQAARLALLLAAPHLLSGLGGLSRGMAIPPLTEMLLTGSVAFITSLIAVNVLLTWLRRRGFGIFAVAQIVLGALTALSVTGFRG